ncbi:GNAT family N-acetyltransferase [Saccharibacillus kuerlensis]|uniref:N-acetyltransferase domain-containing protein n=1 Tax=Saccharibacillus kuerlensis TaxID=459527 RepID=A0ABQ2L6W6_9BACL|nr:GNAT family N-acetyltransferase [Saccharibacillus kuerlensis]GGO02368.1 hypothetical protein GCM10010969_25600 [Saccharibacillus kuerlensis]
MKRQELRIEKEIVKTVRMDYQLYIPPSHEDEETVKEKPPLILYLHGAGGSGSEPDLVRREGLPDHVEHVSEFPFIVVAPQCPIGVFWNTKEDEVIAILDEVTERWNVDPERVYLTGYSMGAYGVWHLAVHYPKRFAAIAPVSGGGDPSYARDLQEMPAWIFHGTDDEVIHASESEKIAEAMRKVGAEVELTLYPGSGHDCWKKVYASEALYRWFLEHKISSRSEKIERHRTEEGQEMGSYPTKQIGAEASTDSYAYSPEVSGSDENTISEASDAGNAYGLLDQDGSLITDGTVRLRIQPVTDTDAGDLLALELKNRDFFRQFAETREESFYTQEGQERRVRGAIDGAAVDERYLFTVRLRETGELIGTVDLTGVNRGSLQSAWLGYFLDKDHNGRGYMTESVQFIVRHAFEVLVLHRLEAGVMPHNEASLRVLEKAGFQREGLARQNVKIDGRWQDHVSLGIVNPKDMESDQHTDHV